MFKNFVIYSVLATLLFAPFIGGGFHANAQEQSGASLFLRPSSGTFIVNNTFDVSIILNTNNRSVNAIDAILAFPPDKLQVVSPSLGKSIVGIWATPPTFNNQDGTLRFQGGIPSPGINTSSGVISTITFRVKSVGTATVNILDKSKVFLNDGLGTDILTDKSGGIYNLVLPPPAGPSTISPTHPDQTQWYTNNTIIFEWAGEDKVSGYSYMLNDEPVDTPDDISEGQTTGVAFKNVQDGTHYFHIKSIKNGTWGGVSHYAVKIDATAPAEFKINISPGPKTTSKLPVIDFVTTDNLSGIDHYELKIIPLDPQNLKPLGEDQRFFVETQGRFIPEELGLGNYDVIVRAHDKAGNVREVAQSLNIVNPFFSISDSGLIILGKFSMPWVALFITGVLMMLILMYTLWIIFRKHKGREIKELEIALKDPAIKERLKYLREKHKIYATKGAKALAIILVIGGIFAGNIAVSRAQTDGASFTKLVPPVITTTPKKITNDQLFYIGGNTEITGGQVIIYIQNVQDNQVLNATVDSDEKGTWFYTHGSPLTSGNYLVWTQLKVGNEFSPPSPAEEITVNRTAFQIGASLVSYEEIYFLFSLLLFAIVLILAYLNVYHYYKSRGKDERVMKEIKEAEEAIKVGFITLQRDIAGELAIIHNVKLSKEISKEEAEKEKQLLEDLETVNEYIKKEVSDIRKTA
ncbi:MAG: hypothetical protein HYR95_02185 [Candidatus Colwellbacteria bacterium]|nr:hypothetical protein [Candidatus Colwellbacteria bacterium]